MRQSHFTVSFASLVDLCPRACAIVVDSSVVFTEAMTDIDGNTHSLYADILDEGGADATTTVVSNHVATWCPPCWNIHTTGSVAAIA